MRKNFLGTLLMGALITASVGTFTSCKDYDDDINNLQTQIDGLRKSLDEIKKRVSRKTQLHPSLLMHIIS